MQSPQPLLKRWNSRIMAMVRSLLSWMRSLPTRLRAAWKRRQMARWERRLAPVLLTLLSQLEPVRTDLRAVQSGLVSLREEMVERLLVLAEQRTMVEQLQTAATEQQELLLETLSELKPPAEMQLSQMLGLPIRVL